MQEKNKLLLKKILKYVALFIAASFLAVALIVILVYTGIFGALPGKTELSEISIEEASLVYSTDNVIIG